MTARPSSSVGGLHLLVDSQFDPLSKPSSSYTSTGHPQQEEEEESFNEDEADLQIDEEDEEEDIDVGDNNEDGNYESPGTKTNQPLLSSSSSSSSANFAPRRRTRSCAVPDVQKTQETVTLDDLLKKKILRPGIFHHSFFFCSFVPFFVPCFVFFSLSFFFQSTFF